MFFFSYKTMIVNNYWSKRKVFLLSINQVTLYNAATGKPVRTVLVKISSRRVIFVWRKKILK